MIGAELGPLRCSWCGREVSAGDGFRLLEQPGTRRAVFCRLEHIVPWSIRGPRHEPGAVGEASELDDAVDGCSFCEAPLGEARLLLVRHRGEHRVPDGFCSAGHLLEWAKAGGRWRSSS